MRHIPRHSTRMDRLEACTKDLAELVTKFVTTINATLSIDRQQTSPTNSQNVGAKQSGQAKEEDRLEKWLGKVPLAKQ
ncbi:hypothetical protein TIFTF001_022889 [Ficus carica]|uniref:Uncharacterized protein n=1 Tax=Ficus carica TaxID=3494 RepID=A0AA88AF92_FICCA|nr:hypothetical protein TIFTF001_022889 [Ficus carica]